MKHLTDDHKLNKLLLFLVYFTPIFTFSNNTLSIVAIITMMVSVLILFFTDDYVLVLPVLIFFYSQLVLPGGLVVSRIFSIVFLIKTLITKNIRFKKRFILPLCLFLIYSLAVIGTINLRLALSIIIDILFIMIYIANYLTNKYQLTEFFKFYSIAAVSASIYGFLRASLQIKTAVQVNGTWIYVTRYLATFNDPNYFGFFLNIAIFSIISLEVFKNKLLKLFILIILYTSLLATLSTTALLCNLFGLLIFFILKKEYSFKNLSIVICISLLVIYMYNSGLYKEIPIISDASNKIQSKLGNILNNNFDEFTTNRSFLWRYDLNIFVNQPIAKILIGGNRINNYVYDEGVFLGVSHQELIDMLLNVGIIGTLILISHYIYNTGNKLFSFFKYKNEEDLLILMLKYVWLFYAFGLTMFPAWMFYLFYFL